MGKSVFYLSQARPVPVHRLRSKGRLAWPGQQMWMWESGLDRMRNPVPSSTALPLDHQQLLFGSRRPESCGWHQHSTRVKYTKWVHGVKIFKVAGHPCWCWANFALKLDGHTRPLKITYIFFSSNWHCQNQIGHSSKQACRFPNSAEDFQIKTNVFHIKLKTLQKVRLISYLRNL